MAFFDSLKEKVSQAVDSAKQTTQNVSTARAEKKEAEAQVNQQRIAKALADAARNALTFEIVKKDDAQFVHIIMDDSAIQTEAGAMYYNKGNITMDASSGPGLGAALLTGESIRRPIYSGTGELYLEPSYGEYTIFDVDNQEWLINYGRYYASELSVVLGLRKNDFASGFLSGHGFYQTTVSGQGKVILESDGPLQKIELHNEKLVVSGNLAIIWSASLDFKMEQATKGLLDSALSGNVLMNTFSGTGVVYLCPVINKMKYLANQICGGIESVLNKIDG